MIMTKKTMRIMKMKTVEEVDIETREEAREIMEAEAAIEVQEDIALMMKITMMKIITKKTMMMIMTKKMKAEAAWEEAVVEVQVAVPAEGLAP
jgi:hypothetical protein